MEKFRVNAQRAKTAETFIWITAGLSFLSMIFNFWEFRIYSNALNGVYISMQEAQLYQIKNVIFALVEVGIFVFAAISFIKWFRRAYYNQELRFSMTTTNGWTSGAWFIPIYNLFRPYQLMKELYENAESFLAKNGLDENKSSRFMFLGWWWGLWITVNIGQNIVTRITMNSEALGTLQSLSIASMVIDFLWIPLSYFAVKVIRNYNEMELLYMSHGGEIAPAGQENNDLLDAGI